MDHYTQYSYCFDHYTSQDRVVLRGALSKAIIGQMVSNQKTTTATSLPGTLRPMLARLWRRPFDSPDYLFELKWDGIRAIALVEDGSYTLQDRNGHDLTEVFPELSRLP